MKSAKIPSSPFPSVAAFFKGREGPHFRKSDGLFAVRCPSRESREGPHFLNDGALLDEVILRPLSCRAILPYRPRRFGAIPPVREGNAVDAGTDDFEIDRRAPADAIDSRQTS